MRKIRHIRLVINYKATSLRAQHIQHINIEKQYNYNGLRKHKYGDGGAGVVLNVIR